MEKKKYEGNMNKIVTNKIYLNINHLEKGDYKLKIIQKNKVIMSTHFTKE